jgi:hypothetical protein
LTPELDTLLGQIEPPVEANRKTRLLFGLACSQRVSHFLERPEVLANLRIFEEVINRQDWSEELTALATQSAQMASSHQGSKSLDGVGHAAVSATYACAKAIEGKARQAAEYAAYAMVYGEGGYGATCDASAFEREFSWQAEQLRRLLKLPHGRTSAA